MRVDQQALFLQASRNGDRSRAPADEADQAGEKDAQRDEAGDARAPALDPKLRRKSQMRQWQLGQEPTINLGVAITVFPWAARLTGLEAARMPAVFRPSANVLAWAVLLGIAGMLLLAVAWWWAWPGTAYARHVGWSVDQPVPFSHEHHVAGLAIDCHFCHASVEAAPNAGMPPTYTGVRCWPAPRAHPIFAGLRLRYSLSADRNLLHPLHWCLSAGDRSRARPRRNRGLGPA